MKNGIYICDQCGSYMKVPYTWFKGPIRKRLIVCPKCGSSFTTSETRDRPILPKPDTDKKSL